MAIIINRITIRIIKLVYSKNEGVYNFSRDAGSFTSPYDFELGNKVKIDGRGHGTGLNKIRSTTGDMYEVMLYGTEFIITVRDERLTQFEMKSESDSRSTGNPTRTITNKRFVEVQSDDILNFVNQQKNRNTL